MRLMKERPWVFLFQKEEEKITSKSLFIAQACLIGERMLGSNYKMQYPASFVFCHFLHDA